MKWKQSMGEALLTELDLRSLRCLICGCPADGETFRITQAEDGRWLAICDDCCDFFRDGERLAPRLPHLRRHRPRQEEPGRPRPCGVAGKGADRPPHRPDESRRARQVF